MDWLQQHPVDDDTALTPDQALSRWSPDVRYAQYAFEFLTQLRFGGTVDGNGKPNEAKVEYTGSGGATVAIKLAPPGYEKTGGKTDLHKAINEVLDAASLRPDRMSEILTQTTPPIAFYGMILNLQPGRHRFTLELLAAVFRMSTFISMQFKHHFRARRPADRSVLVQPVLLTPGHGAYPAGHATQCYFAARVLTKLVGDATAGEDYWGIAGNDLPGQLDRLAARIAHNRVVAGLHYPEDNVAGMNLGIGLAAYLLDRAQDNNSALYWLLDRARAEWGGTWP
jgi:hypothetical protein